MATSTAKNDDPDRPTLKRRAPDAEIPVDAEPTTGEDEPDERPTLKRKYDVVTDDGE
jgi:hypothetical protein